MNKNIEKKTGTEDTILARWYDNGELKEITIKEYLKYVKEKNKEKLAEFVCQRLYTRYLKPFEYDDKKYIDEYKNGFSIMANCCLLIETLLSFKAGRKDNKDEILKNLFENFLGGNDNLKEFQGIGFYNNIRCGILHQGETTGGWKIRREGKLIDKTNHIINSTLFADKLKKSLEAYSDELKKSDWENELWKNFINKMDAVIENCKYKEK
ncbi:MAG: hypothetical protein LBJ63_04830 [Prevotellaceae bacterium]|jgi:hypothetical protein|nr:hypothetical protein [Prevotellaceae bacterium]